MVFETAIFLRQKTGVLINLVITYVREESDTALKLWNIRFSCLNLLNY